MCSCGQKELRQPASGATLSRVSGCRIDRMSPRMEHASGLSVQSSHGCILKMNALQESHSLAAAAMSCWRELLPTLVCDPVCTFGSERIGMLHAPRVRLLCQFTSTSALELHSSFGYLIRRNNEHSQTRAFGLVQCHADGPHSKCANQAH